MRRRRFLAGLSLLPAASALAGIRQRTASRVIVDNDFAGDPDGLVALAHQLLSTTARTVLITASALDPKLAALAGVEPGTTARKGARLAGELLDRLGLARRPPVVAGGEQADPAARAIVAEAMRDDPLPLLLTCGGPLTNVAAALRLEPAIAKRMTLVWLGGSSAAEGAAEYNLVTDLAAARYVLEESLVPVWQIPESEYKRFQVSIAELDSRFRPISPVSEWLYSQYLQLPPFVELGGSLTFGDSAMVSLSAFDPALTPTTLRPVRKLLDDGRHGVEIAGRSLRMVQGIDVRLNLADFMARLRLQAGQPKG